jgi:hypothetical protein
MGGGCGWVFTDRNGGWMDGRWRKKKKKQARSRETRALI